MTTPATPSKPPMNTIIMNDVNKYVLLAAAAVQEAQKQGVGQPGATKAQIALGLVHSGLTIGGNFVPGLGAAGMAIESLEPIFLPLFTGLVNLFRHKQVPAFVAPASPAPGQ